MKLGLKAAIHEKQFFDRFAEQPDVFEIHLFDEDLFGKKKQLLENRIQFLQEYNIQVVLHHPILFGKEPQDMFSNNDSIRSFYQTSSLILAELCKTYSIPCVIHTDYSGSKVNGDYEKMFANQVPYLQEKSDNWFYWENSIKGIFTFENEHIVESLIKPLNLPMCFDISHAFISFNGDNTKLLNALEETKSYVKHYHVVDSMGKDHDSLPLGTGRIDWKAVKPYLENAESYIYEVGLQQINNCREMIDSHRYLVTL